MAAGGYLIKKWGRGIERGGWSTPALAPHPGYTRDFGLSVEARVGLGTYLVTSLRYQTSRFGAAENPLNNYYEYYLSLLL